MIIQYVREHFKPFMDKIRSLQKRKRQYLIQDIFELMLRSNVDHVRSRCEETARLESLENASTGNISYWTSMIYNNLDGYDELFQPTVQHSTNRIAAVDGTCIAIAIKNKYGVSQGGATISSIIDVNTTQFIDYKVSYSMNETVYWFNSEWINIKV